MVLYIIQNDKLATIESETSEYAMSTKWAKFLHCFIYTAKTKSLTSDNKSADRLGWSIKRNDWSGDNVSDQFCSNTGESLKQSRKRPPLIQVSH